MTERNQAEEIARAADKFAESARELSDSLDRFLNFQQVTIGGETYVWTEEVRRQRRKPLSEEEAVELALRAVEEVREEKAQTTEWEQEERIPAPSPDEVRKRRAERRKREAEEEDS